MKNLTHQTTNQIKAQIFSQRNSFDSSLSSAMVYSYTPTYYSTLQDSITSICKSILPFNFKKRSLLSSEHKLSKLQSDNLKWQQESFHQMLNMTGLHNEGILAESEVSSFRNHLLETLIVSPLEQEHPTILRDKLLFLQELLYAKCISEQEYHASKRPLLHRLAVQGVEIEARDVIVASKKDMKSNSNEEWSVVDLKDEQCLLRNENFNSKNKSKQGSAMKQIKGVAFSFVSYKPGKNIEKSVFESPSVKMEPVQSKSSVQNEMGSSKENPFWDVRLNEKEKESRSILMPESKPPLMTENNGGGDLDNTEKFRRKPFKTLFQRDQNDGHGGRHTENGAGNSEKKQWGFDGFRKWKRSETKQDGDTGPLPLNEKSGNQFCMDSNQLVARTVGEGPDTKLIKRKLHSNGSPSDFFIDKVLGDNIKKALSRIQVELSTTNPNLKFTDDQIEAISTMLPADKADLKKYFPKSWCDQYGDVVLDVVKKEFKDHVGEMEKLRKNSSRGKHTSNLKRWTTFEDENSHPNLFDHQVSNFVKSSLTNPFMVSLGTTLSKLCS